MFTNTSAHYKNKISHKRNEVIFFQILSIINAIVSKVYCHSDYWLQFIVCFLSPEYTFILMTPPVTVAPQNSNRVVMLICHLIVSIINVGIYLSMYATVSRI